MQPNEQKAPPPVEQSLKYMAWDMKQLGVAVKDVTAELHSLNMTFQAIHNVISSLCKKQSSKSSCCENGFSSDEPPF